MEIESTVIKNQVIENQRKTSVENQNMEVENRMSENNKTGNSEVRSRESGTQMSMGSRMNRTQKEGTQEPPIRTTTNPTQLVGSMGVNPTQASSHNPTQLIGITLPSPVAQIPMIRMARNSTESSGSIRAGRESESESGNRLIQIPTPMLGTSMTQAIGISGNSTQIPEIQTGVNRNQRIVTPLQMVAQIPAIQEPPARNLRQTGNRITNPTTQIGDQAQK